MLPSALPSQTTHKHPTDSTVIQLKDPALRSRLLYPNPVVLLMSLSPENSEWNVMTLSWLTPINNRGRFMFSINRRRASTKNLTCDALFTLSVPTTHCRDLVVQIGSTSNNQKISRLQIEVCNAGWNLQSTLLAVNDCIAHLCCRVDSISDNVEDKHLICFCTITDAYVKDCYWTGKQFIPQSPELPPYLTFLGTKMFAGVYPVPNFDEKNDE